MEKLSDFVMCAKTNLRKGSDTTWLDRWSAALIIPLYGLPLFGSGAVKTQTQVTQRQEYENQILIRKKNR